MSKRMTIAGFGGAVMLVLAASVALAATNVTPPTLRGPETSIAFPNLEIRDWHVNDENGIYIQTNGRKWYYATFFSPCHSIQFAMGVAFLASGGAGSLDRFGKVYSRTTGRCNFTSLRETLTPPVKKARA